jgi:CubicO group peptidase (beta-lactamase class C family)
MHYGTNFVLYDRDKAILMGSTRNQSLQFSMQACFAPRRRIRALLIAGFTFLLNIPGVAQGLSRLSPNNLQTADSLIREWMQQQHIVGLSAALVLRGELVHTRGYGYADREQKIPASESTLYRVASLSKTITAAAVLHAADQGLLSLSDSVQRYVPEFPVRSSIPLTVEHLLACEGGLQHYAQTAPYRHEALEDYFAGHLDCYDPLAALELFREQAPLAEPGKRFNYSTFSFNLLGAVLERASGTTYQQYVQEHIAGRAGLTTLQPEFAPRRPYPGQASWYRASAEGAAADTGMGPDHTDISWKLAGGGYLGSALDMAGFAQGLLNGAYLDSLTRERMFTMRRIGGQPTYYGLGIFLKKHRGRLYASQFGTQAGARSMLYLNPASGHAVVLLSNTSNTDLAPLARDLMDRLEHWQILDSLQRVLLPGQELIGPSEPVVDSGKSSGLRSVRLLRRGGRAPAEPALWWPGSLFGEAEKVSAPSHWSSERRDDVMPLGFTGRMLACRIHSLSDELLNGRLDPLSDLKLSV